MKFNNTFNIFETPIWYIEKDLPEGVYEWALDMERNVKGTQLSNRGGYQSEWLDIPNFKYLDHLRSMMVFLPEFHFSNMWVNINRKGDYNWRHTHPGSDLACIWYITENLNKLVLEDHMNHTRDNLFRAFGNDCYGTRDFNAKAGSLVMFPGDVPHWVEPHEENTPRISLSFNIIFK